MDVRPVVVLGGTGNVGRQVVAALLEEGAPVRVLSRSAARAREVLGEEVELLEGDVCDPEVQARVLEGGRAVVVGLSAFSKGAIEHQRQIEEEAVLSVMARCATHGPRRFVYLSGYGETADRPLRAILPGEFAEIKQRMEAAIWESELDWTILGLPPSMDLFFALSASGKRLIAPGGGPSGGVPVVAPRDEGLAIARAALRHDLGRQRILVPGPEALTFDRAAQILGEAWGRELPVLAPPKLPFRLLASVGGLFSTYHQQFGQMILLLAAFPEEVSARVPQEHARLVELFDLQPTTLLEEAQRRGPPA